MRWIYLCLILLIFLTSCIELESTPQRVSRYSHSEFYDFDGNLLYATEPKVEGSKRIGDPDRVTYGVIPNGHTEKNAIIIHSYDSTLDTINFLNGFGSYNYDSWWPDVECNLDFKTTLSDGGMHYYWAISSDSALLAIKNNDSSLCNYYTGTHISRSTRNNCLFAMGVYTGNSSYCKNIKFDAEYNSDVPFDGLSCEEAIGIFHTEKRFVKTNISIKSAAVAKVMEEHYDYVSGYLSECGYTIEQVRSARPPPTGSPIKDYGNRGSFLGFIGKSHCIFC